MSQTILLADDSLTIQKVVELALTARGYQVISVGNGNEAASRLDEVEADLVLTDVIMPGKNGYELCTYIKDHPQHARLPVMLMVGSTEPFDAAQARSVGADDFIRKPFDGDALAQKVESLLGAQPAPAEEPEGEEEVAYDDIWESLDEGETAEAAEELPDAALLSEADSGDADQWDESAAPEEPAPSAAPASAESATAPPAATADRESEASGVESALSRGLQALVQDASTRALTAFDQRIGPEVEQAVDRYLSTCLQPLVHGQVERELTARVPEALAEQLDADGDTGLEQRVDRQLESRLDQRDLPTADGIREQVDAALERQLSEAVDAAVARALDERLAAVVEERLEATVPERIERALDERLEKLLADRLEALVDNRLESQVEHRLGSAVDERLDRTLPDQLESRLGREFERLATTADTPLAARLGEIAAHVADTRVHERLEAATSDVARDVSERIESVGRESADKLTSELERQMAERFDTAERATVDSLESRFASWLDEVAGGRLESWLGGSLPKIAEEVVERRLDALERSRS